MATENKRLNTRLMLKYDTYENWSTNNPNLLKGEITPDFPASILHKHPDVTVIIDEAAYSKMN